MAALSTSCGSTQTVNKPEAAIASASSSPPTYRTQTIPCPVALPAETEGKTVTCGVLTVPENYEQPNGRQVEITYARFYSTSQSPLPDPIFFLEGGPGGSSVSRLDFYSRVIFVPHRQTRDVVFFDQRGTQFSSSLGCAPTAFALDKLGNKFDQYVKKIADNNPLTNDRTIAQHALCAQVLQKHGFDLSQFNTPNSARDTVNLATALGYKQINLYGISYGTYLAMAIARNYPTVVRSVVLDSTATPHVNKYTEAGKRNVTPVVNLLEDCAADPACNQAYPNLQARLNALLEKLAKQPIPLPKTTSATPPGAPPPETSITLESFANNVPQWLGQRIFGGYLPLMIAELERGETTTYVQALSGKLFESDPKPEGLPVVEQYRKLATNFEIKAQELLQANAAAAQANRPSAQWVKQVKTSLKTLPEPQQNLAIANFYGAGYDADRARDRKTLLDLIAEIFPTKTAQPLQAKLQIMNEAEIRHIYELLTDSINQVSPVDEGGIMIGMTFSFDCREHVSWSSVAEAEAMNRSLPLPLLAQASFGENLEFITTCKHWPVKPADPIERQVVKINVPTLVLQGRYDASTTTDRGKRALEWLSKGTYVEFYSQGHVVLPNPCGRDIGIAFINRPEIPPNPSCTAALKPKFVLPTTSK